MTRVFARDDIEGQVKLVLQLVLPLLHKIARCDDQTPLQVTTNNQFLDQKPGHNGLAGTGVIGKQKPQRLTRKHFTIYGGDLMWQRLDAGAVNCKVGIKEMSEPDALGL